jgi:hypothetical protein
MKNEIDRQIRAWAEERGLDKVPYNHDFARASQYEEKAEEYRARGNNDHYGIIDSLADAYVYATVDGFKKGADHSFLTAQRKIVERTFFNEYGCSITLALEETLKEINSRKGAFNQEAGKWVKDTSDEAKKLWYKADYSKIVRMKVK